MRKHAEHSRGAEWAWKEGEVFCLDRGEIVEKHSAATGNSEECETLQRHGEVEQLFLEAPQW